MAGSTWAGCPLVHLPTLRVVPTFLLIMPYLVQRVRRFPSIRHNEVRDITAELLSEVCHDVEVEPHLQPLTLSDERFQQKTANTQDGACLDIAMNGFWGGCYEKCYTDIRVFNPLAPSNSGTTLQSCYRKHEITKKKAYEL